MRIIPRISIAFTMILITILVLAASASCVRDENTNIAIISPEAAGWSSQKLKEVAQHADSIGCAALMLTYDGKMFFSWGETKRNFKVHSIRKAFLSALYGIYVNNKTIDLNLSMDDLGIDDIHPKLTASEKEATVRHLLQSRSGIYHEAAAETQVMKNARPERGSHPPGTHFYYNNWDFNVLGTVFEQLTGKKIFKEFETRIAEPIGMQDFDVSICNYQHEPESEHPKYSFRMSARDMTRFGQLYLNRGEWNGKQIIPESWITESLTSYSEQSGAGFGYSWGIIHENSRFAEIFGGSGFFFFGHGGHGLVVIPELKLVQVVRVDTNGEFTPPKDSELIKLFSMISDARIKQASVE